MDRDGEPNVSYVDICKDDFDGIVDQEKFIGYLLQSNTYKTVYQNENVHVWVKPGNKPMVCFQTPDRIRINMIEQTFERLMNRVDWVQYAFDQFMGDLDNDEYSSNFDETYCDDHTDDSDESYHDDYTDDSDGHPSDEDY